MLTTVIVAVLGVIGPGHPAAGQETPTRTVTFDAVAQTTWVGGDGTWTIDLAVRGAPGGSSVSARILPRLRDRDEYYASLFLDLADDELVDLPTLPLDKARAVADGGRQVRYGVALRDAPATGTGVVNLSRGLIPGVYPVRVDVVDTDGGTVATFVTHITRVADPDEADADAVPMLLATVLGLETPIPATAPDGSFELSEAALADGGALADLLEGAPDLPLTLAPTPETVEALSRDPAGRADLVRIANDLAGRQLIDRPYVDVPFPAWVAEGMDAEIDRQRQRGSDVLRRALSPPDSSTWLATSGLTPEAGADLWRAGVRTVVLANDALVPDPDDPTTPVTPVEVPTTDTPPVSAVIADVGIAAALTRRQDLELDMAGLAAELALLADDDTTAARGVVLAPGPTTRLDAELLGSLTFLLLSPLSPVRPVTVAGLVAQVADGGRRDLAAPPPAGLGSYPEDLGRIRNRLASFASLVGRDDPEVASLDQRLLLSAGRSLNPRQRAGYLAEVETVVERRLGSVQAPARQTITLPSSSGRIPLTLRSRLRRPVEVRVRLETGSRLEFPDGAEFPLRLEPGTNRIDIPVRARVPGDSPITIRIESPDGAASLVNARYTVRSTAVSGLGLVLSVGAVVFLVLWWARHVRRDRRRRRETASDAETTGPMSAPAT